MKCIEINGFKQFQDENCNNNEVLLCSIYNNKINTSYFELQITNFDEIKEQFNQTSRNRLEKKAPLEPFFEDFEKYEFYIIGKLNKTTRKLTPLENIKVGENMLDFLDEDIKEVVLQKKLEKLKKEENYKNTIEEYKKLKELLKK